MKDFKMPVAIITFLAAQAGGMVWFLSGLQSRVKALESFDSGIEVTASVRTEDISEKLSCLLMQSVTTGSTHTIKCG